MHQLDEKAITDYSDEVHLAPAKLTRIFLITCGFLCVALGLAGAILPILPTTPFLLLAAACFAKGSKRFYNWLMNNRYFGDYIHNWRAEKAMALRHKITAIAMIVVTGSVSIAFFIPLWQIQLAVGLVCLAVIMVILRFKTKPKVTFQGIKAMVFDLDGTLLNTLSDIADSMNQVLVRHHYRPHSTRAYKAFIGAGMKNLVKRALPVRDRNEETLQQMLSELQEVYQVNYTNKSPLYKGIDGVLKKLVQRQLKLAVLSNKMHSYTQELVSQRFGENLFQQVVGAKEHVPLKPDPTSLLALCAALKVKPEEVIYVGDTGSDMQVAKNAGAIAVGVGWGFRSVSELRSAGADAIVHHPKELAKILI